MELSVSRLFGIILSAERYVTRAVEGMETPTVRQAVSSIRKLLLALELDRFPSSAPSPWLYKKSLNICRITFLSNLMCYGLIVSVIKLLANGNCDSVLITPEVHADNCTIQWA